MTGTALPAVGSVAPEFTLASTSGTDVTLSTLRGKRVLLAFFPAAFTRVCTAELCAFSEEYGQFADADTVVLPLSVDSVESLKEFKAKEHMTVHLLSDFRRQVSRAYGALDEGRFRAIRAYVLIDAQGVVRWTHAEEHPGLRRTNEELLAQVKAIA